MQHINKTESIEKMQTILSQDGVFIIDNYLSGDDLEKLHSEVLDRCKSKGGHYEFGRNYRGDSIFSYDNDNIIRKVYDVQWMKDLYSAYSNNSKGYGINVFATHDYKFTGELARNGWPHFDRHWRLKFFIYLTDIDITSGAFSCSVGSIKAGSELRKNAWRQPKYEDVKNRIELDYPELLDSYPDEAVEGKAGTLIVFDTDTFHKGGKCDEGKERLIVRLHCG